MQYRKLGRTDIEVSRLCFGSLPLGPLQHDMPPEKGGEIIAEAFSLGVNFIDTAQLYGTYPHIKHALKLTRRDIVISSKTYAYEKDAAFQAVEQARRETGRDVIDIFMLHEQESIHTLRGHMEALDELYRLKSLNIIRAVGVSAHHVAAVRGALSLGLDAIHPMLNKNGLGIIDGTHQDMEEALTLAHASGIGIFSMKAIGGGNLFRESDDCLSYVLGLPFTDSIAVGMKNISEVRANIHFFDNLCFPDGKNGENISKSRQILVEDYCTGCGSCVDICPQKALVIKDNFAVCDHLLCVLCGYCSSKCREFCIKIV